MIKAFLFDYDGVITAGVGDGIPASRLAKNLGISLEQATDWIVNGIWERYSTGLMTDDEVWAEFEQKYGKSIGPEQRDVWYTWEELTPLPETRELVKLLKSKGYPVGVASNVLPVTAQVIRENGGYEDFDFLVLSCEVGARKPNPKVYKAALAQLKGMAADEVVFLDDRQSCVVGAQESGLKALHVTDHAQLIAKIHRLIAVA